jgi:signal transduction histidine kinase
VLGGGFPRGQLFLIEGNPGASVLPRDSELTCAHLRGLDIDARVLRNFDELLERASQTIGAFIVTEEAVPSGGWSRVASILERHPAWSDVPFIVCVRRRMAAMDHVLSAISGNVTVIETPIRVSTMLSAAKVALRARRRQYEVRDLLARLEETDRRKDEFLAMLGHELRNPLAAMSLALQLKQMESADAKGDRSLEVIERQMRNLGRMRG